MSDRVMLESAPSSVQQRAGRALTKAQQMLVQEAIRLGCQNELFI
jgi:hypothetical protein